MKDQSRENIFDEGDLSGWLVDGGYSVGYSELRPCSSIVFELGQMEDG